MPARLWALRGRATVQLDPRSTSRRPLHASAASTAPPSRFTSHAATPTVATASSVAPALPAFDQRVVPVGGW